MKAPLFIALLLFLFSCSNEKVPVIDVAENQKPELRELVYPAFQAILDEADVNGSILVYDLNDNTFYSNNFEWANKGQLPASTFKIPNSMIALETKVVESDSSILKWKGENRRLELWEQDLSLRDAFHYSCVPCYQEIARSIGINRMREYIAKLKFGNMTVDSSDIDLFWLQGESRISQFQQIDFLKRFYHSELMINDRTESILRRMMVIEEHEQYTLRGKTGWSIENETHNGWFVGYLETKTNVHFFATNIEPNAQFDMNRFSIIRKQVNMRALEKLGVLNEVPPSL